MKFDSGERVAPMAHPAVTPRPQAQAPTPTPVQGTHGRPGYVHRTPGQQASLMDNAKVAQAAATKRAMIGTPANTTTMQPPVDGPAIYPPSSRGSAGLEAARLAASGSPVPVGNPAVDAAVANIARQRDAKRAAIEQVLANSQPAKPGIPVGRVPEGQEGLWLEQQYRAMVDAYNAQRGAAQ